MLGWSTDQQHQEMEEGFGDPGALRCRYPALVTCFLEIQKSCKCLNGFSRDRALSGLAYFPFMEVPEVLYIWSTFQKWARSLAPQVVAFCVVSYSIWGVVFNDWVRNGVRSAGVLEDSTAIFWNQAAVDDFGLFSNIMCYWRFHVSECRRSIFPSTRWKSAGGAGAT